MPILIGFYWWNNYLIRQKFKNTAMADYTLILVFNFVKYACLSCFCSFQFILVLPTH